MSKMFSGFNNVAATGQGGVYLNAGHDYLLEVRKVEFFRGRNGDFLIHEFRIHESNDPDRPAGSIASWLVKWGTDMTFPNFKAFLAAVNGIDPTDRAAVDAEITEDVAELAVSPAQPLRGKMVEVSVVLVKTRKGEDFSKHIWRPTNKRPVVSVAAPSVPQAPQVPPAPPAQAVFPPPGWTAHPTAGWFYKGSDVVSEAELRARVAAGRA